MLDKSYILSIIMCLTAICVIMYNSRNSTKQESNNTKVTLYYANWCGYSKMFLPEWNKFEKYAQKNLKDIKVNKVLCEGETAANKCSHLRGYPSVVVNKGDNVIPYNGERNKKTLVKFIKNL